MLIQDQRRVSSPLRRLLVSQQVRETETWMPMKTTQTAAMLAHGDAAESSGSDFGFTDDEDTLYGVDDGEGDGEDDEYDDEDDDEYDDEDDDEFSGSGDGAATVSSAAQVRNAPRGVQ